MRNEEKSGQSSNEKSAGCTYCELSADVGSGRSESGGGSTGGKHLDGCDNVAADGGPAGGRTAKNPLLPESSESFFL